MGWDGAWGGSPSVWGGATRWGKSGRPSGRGRQAAQQRPRRSGVAALTQELVTAQPEQSHGVAGGVAAVGEDRSAAERDRGDGDSAALGQQGMAAVTGAAVETGEPREDTELVAACRSYGQVVIGHGNLGGWGGSRRFTAVREPDGRSVVSGRVRRRGRHCSGAAGQSGGPEQGAPGEQ